LQQGAKDIAKNFDKPNLPSAAVGPRWRMAENRKTTTYVTSMYKTLSLVAVLTTAFVKLLQKIVFKLYGFD